MALAIPPYAVAADHIATALYARLSSALTDRFKLYQHLSGNGLPSGALFGLQKGNSSVFVFVCRDEPQEDGSHQATTFKNQTLKQLVRFQEALLPIALKSHAKLIAPFIVIFPKSMKPDTALYLKTRGFYIFGRDALVPERFARLVNQYMGSATSHYVLAHMRCRFRPESVIKNTQSLHVSYDDSPLQVDDFLLSDEQEFALKQDLVLMHNSRPHKYNLRLVQGTSGSGKSVVLLHRAKLLRALYPEKNILVLTHNKAINHYLKSRYKYLFSNKDNESECRPFMEWCLRQWKGLRRFVFEDEVMDIVQQTLGRHLKGTVFTMPLLLREINFIKDRLVFTEKEYLNVDRSGQGYSLDSAMRERVWRAVIDFDAELAAKQVLLWADLPRLLWLEVIEGRVELEVYDHVLIDEAQYFAPIWFELIKKSIKPDIGQLFMVADPDQGFLNRRLHWKETGIDLRDRTFRLQQNYRSNPLILNVADAFRFNRLPDETVHILSAKPSVSLSEERYTAPTLLHFHDEQDEHKRLFSEINGLLQEGVAPQDILVLDAGNFSVRPLLQNIKKRLGQPACILTDPYWDEDALRVCELAAATGLESPIVFITGLQALFEEEKKLSIGDRERHALMIENTRKLYMGMTRASQKLVLLLTMNHIPDSLQVKTINISTKVSDKLATVSC